MSKQALEFVVQHPGERAAGIRSYIENVKIELECGGWDAVDLEEHFRFALADFFDGANIYTKAEADNLWRDEADEHAAAVAEYVED